MRWKIVIYNLVLKYSIYSDVRIYVSALPILKIRVQCIVKVLLYDIMKVNVKTYNEYLKRLNWNIFKFRLLDDILKY